MEYIGLPAIYISGDTIKSISDAYVSRAQPGVWGKCMYVCVCLIKMCKTWRRVFGKTFKVHSDISKKKKRSEKLVRPRLSSYAQQHCTMRYNRQWWFVSIYMCDRVDVLFMCLIWIDQPKSRNRYQVIHRCTRPSTKLRCFSNYI